MVNILAKICIKYTGGSWTGKRYCSLYTGQSNCMKCWWLERLRVTYRVGQKNCTLSHCN